MAGRSPILAVASPIPWRSPILAVASPIPYFRFSANPGPRGGSSSSCRGRSATQKDVGFPREPGHDGEPTATPPTAAGRGTRRHRQRRARRAGRTPRRHTAVAEAARVPPCAAAIACLGKSLRTEAPRAAIAAARHVCTARAGGLARRARAHAFRARGSVAWGGAAGAGGAVDGREREHRASRGGVRRDQRAAARRADLRVQPPFASRSLPRALLTRQVTSGSRLSLQQEHLRAVRGPCQEERSLTFAQNNPRRPPGNALCGGGRAGCAAGRGLHQHQH